MNQVQHPDHQPHQPYGANPVPPRNASLRDLPAAMWVGLVIAAVGFVVKFEYQFVSNFDGYTCEYTNYAGFMTAGAIGICLVTAWVRRGAMHVRARAAMPLMLAVSLLLVVLGVVHVLRGTGTIQNPCDSHPMP